MPFLIPSPQAYRIAVVSAGTTTSPCHHLLTLLPRLCRQGIRKQAAARPRHLPDTPHAWLAPLHARYPLSLDVLRKAGPEPGHAGDALGFKPRALLPGLHPPALPPPAGPASGLGPTAGEATPRDIKALAVAVAQLWADFSWVLVESAAAQAATAARRTKTRKTRRSSPTRRKRRSHEVTAAVTGTVGATGAIPPPVAAPRFPMWNTSRRRRP